MQLHFTDSTQALLGLADHGRHLVKHAENLIDAALVEHRHLHAVAYQGRRDIRLQIGKAEHAIGLQRQDFVYLGAGERTDARLFSPGNFRPDCVARDTRNAMRLAEHVQPLGGFLGHADDALG